MEYAYGDLDPLLEFTISTMIIWRYNGHEVAIEGSWDNLKKNCIVCALI